MEVEKLVEAEPRKPVTTHQLMRQFTSFSGVDVRTLINGENDGLVQAISFGRVKQDGQWITQGSIIRLCLDIGAGTLPDHIDHIQVIGSNEYGASAIFFEVHDVEIIACGSGVSIDDMVIEEQYTFSAREFKPGRSLTKTDFAKATRYQPVHVKRTVTPDDPERKALIEQAVEATAKEPSYFIQELAELLTRYKVIL